MKSVLFLFAILTVSPAAVAASAGNECKTDLDCDAGYTCEGSSAEAPGLCMPRPDDPNTGPIVAPAATAHRAELHAFFACNG